MRKVKNLDKLVKVIDEAFANYFNKQDTKMENQPLPEGLVRSRLYESIEDFAAKNGKRFRMTKDQKQRGLTRDEAFDEANPITHVKEEN